MKILKKFFLLFLLCISFQSYAQLVVSRQSIENISYVKLEDISSLFTSVSWTVDKRMFIVKRIVDNNEFRLNLDTGELVWNMQVIGIVPNSGKINAETQLFPVNVIESLSGTNAKLIPDKVTFEFDTKLKNGTNWILYINGDLISSNIKSIGNVLLLPIDVVAKKLGSTVEISQDTILYRRIQDAARIELNINTGIIKVNERVQGTVGNLFYIDRPQKLVPLNILEILAGIVFDIDPNTNKINVSLDSRIANTAFGSKLIAQELKNTPLTVQSLSYDVNSEGMTTLKLDTYLSSYNTRINYQSGGNILEKGGVKPSLLNFQWSSYEGSSGTIGDVNLGNRQLSGINVSRIKGIEYNNTINDINYSVTAGQIVQNYTNIYAQQANDLKTGSRTYVPLNYGGGAYGLRLYPKNKPYEVGFSYLDDPDLGRKWSIASFTYKSQNTGKEMWNYYFNIDGGHLENRLTPIDTRSGFDIKSVWSANNNYEKYNVSFDGSYNGNLFEQYYQPNLQNLINNSNNIGNNPLSPLLPNIDNVGFSKLSQSASISYKLNDTLAVSYSANYNIRKNEYASYDYLINNIGISKTFKTGYLSLNNLRGKGTDTTGDYKVNIYNVVGQKTFEDVSLLGRVDYDGGTKVYSGQLGAQLNPYRNQWEKVSGVLNTSLNYNFYKRDNMFSNSANLSLNYALTTNYPINGWTMGAGAGSTIRLFENTNNSSNTLSSANGQLVTGVNKNFNPFLFANASYYFSKGFRFQVSASYDSYGKFKVFAGINGDIDFVPPRTVSNYIAKKGVLKGKIFIDDNYDGIEQPEENKAVSVLVSVKGTGLSLNTTNTGNFTIQNLNPGLYELGVSLDNLPLGWAVDENATTRFSIAPDQITEIKVPIRKVHGLTGQVVSLKENDNEGLTVEILKDNQSIKKTLTTFGGQFSFDGLKPDKYTLRLYDINEKVYNKEIALDQAVNIKYLFEIKN